ncbi:MAG: shikimate dehydrogenase [Candidatus Pseudobacter hemicellulosilyticus]|uniref:Shikimate dehydrogenase n=1 Tax=Candidatus Pseudobacter hemicellulosilyticus TaxID=3121375 RepID=A0AAJ5WSP5_9BACT|nr:MAG: shikimate dehydrogenase [Pseudobacter sp.]
MRRFGLIGYPLSHSFSQRYFTEKFHQEQITGCVYENFPLQQISELTAVLAQQSGLNGLNVTIPYKEQVLSFLHHRNEVVQEIGACNCIRIRNGELTGFNTDVIGFEQSLLQYLQPAHRKALVLGTGGAAKAIHYVLRKHGIEFLEVSRTPAPGNNRQLSYEQVTELIVKEYTLIVNTTPLGMYPNVDNAPELPYAALTPAHYLFDLVYNPAMTLFLQRGADRGAAVKNGMDMLVIQAEESWRIWNEP